MKRLPSSPRLGILLLALLLPAFGWAQGLRPVGSLSYLLGEVEISRSGSPAWRAASLNQSLFPGDRIRTGRDGLAEVVFGGESRLRLSSRSDLVIPNQVENQEGLLQRVKVLLGDVWANVRRLARNESFEVEGAHSVGGVKGTRFQLRRGASDRWRLASGRLIVRALNAQGRVELTPGQSVEAGGNGIGRVTGEDNGDMERSYFEFNRKGSSRWQATLTKLLAAERRLVQRAERLGTTFLEEALDRSRQLGQAIQETRRQIQAFVQDRDREEGDSLHGTGNLISFADRTVESHARLDERLQRMQTSGDARRPLRESRGPQPPTKEGEVSDAAVLGQVAATERFLGRFSQGLQRALRLLNTSLAKLATAVASDGTVKIDAAKIRSEATQLRERVVEGYRQSETSVQRARQVVRRVPAPQRSQRAEQALGRVDQMWARIGRDFRLFQNRLRLLLEKLNNPPDLPQRELPPTEEIGL